MFNRIKLLFIISIFLIIPPTTLHAIDFISPIASPVGQVKADTVETVSAKMVYANQYLLSIKVPKSLDEFANFIGGGSAPPIEQIMIGQAAKRFANITIQNNDINATNNKPFSVRWYNVASTFFSPIMVQDRTTHADENLNRQYAISGKLCIKISDNNWLEIPSTTNIKSDKNSLNPDNDVNPDLAVQGLESAENMAAMFAKRKINPDPNHDNNYYYVKSTQSTDTNVDLPCDKALEGVETSTKAEKSQSQNTFQGGTSFEQALMNLYCNAFECVDYPVYWLAAINKPHESSYYCNLASENCSDTGGETPEGNGGGLLTYKPDSITFAEGNHGIVPTQAIQAGTDTIYTKTEFPYYNKTYNTNRGAFCMMTPISKQGDILPERSVVKTTTELAADGKTNVLATTVDSDPCGGFTISSSGGGCNGGNFNISGGGSCQLCHTDSVKSMADDPNTVPEGIPPTLKKVIETAAEKFDIPASSLLAAMYHEGAFTNVISNPFLGGPYVGSNAWTESNVKKWVQCGEPLPNCPAKEVSYSACQGGSKKCGIAVLGTGEMPHWFWQGDGDYAIWNAVQTIDPSRTKDNINPCNFLDSIFATAKQLKMWGQYSRTPPACYGRPMTGSASGSCTDSSWNENTVLQSHVGMWIGTTQCCPDGTTLPTCQIAGNSNNPNYANMVIGWYNAFKCN